jgi:hypothetical protein
VFQVRDVDMFSIGIVRPESTALAMRLGGGGGMASSSRERLRPEPWRPELMEA